MIASFISDLPKLGRWRPTMVWLGRGALAAVVLAASLLWLVLSRTPSFHAANGDPRETLRLTNTILRNSVPDTRRTVTHKVVALTAEDLATIANYALSRKQLEGLARVAMRDRRLRMEAVVKLPWKTMDLYLNIRLIVDDADPDAVIQQLKVGRLALPRPLVGWMLMAAANIGPFARFGAIADEVIRHVRIVDGAMRVEFDWNREALARADDLVTDVALRERMQAYCRSLVTVVSQPEVKRYVRLSSLMQPLFTLARERSAAEGEPIEENRALLLVLHAYVSGRDLGAMIGWPPPGVPVPPRTALLDRRADIAQHFITSAALTVAGTKTLADVVGMAKEINDTHSGSGFSFTDLAADRAGVHFGKFAVGSEETARKLQNTLSTAADESLFMPSLKDLPENLKAAEFQQRFKAIDSPEFAEMKQMIEQRIAACPIYVF